MCTLRFARRGKPVNQPAADDQALHGKLEQVRQNGGRVVKHSADMPAAEQVPRHSALRPSASSHDQTKQLQRCLRRAVLCTVATRRQLTCALPHAVRRCTRHMSPSAVHSNAETMSAAVIDELGLLRVGAYGR